MDSEKRIKGVVTRNQIREIVDSKNARISLGDILKEPVVAHPDEPLRAVVSRMAETGFTRFPVVENGTRNLAGMISLRDLLQARVRSLHEERHREQVLRLRLPFSERTAASR